MKKGLFIGFMCLCFSFNSLASMPFYDDDEEFEQCKKITDDRDRCIREETKRVLNDVKTIYKQILNNPNLNASPEISADKVAFMSDMYSMWTAFRNRLCSLTNVATRYTGSWQDEELSCNLYYAMHHRDYLGKVAKMLNSNPNDENGNQKDLDYIIIDNHDDEYTACMKKEKPDENKCIDEELKRSMKDIKDLYNSFYTSEFTQKWNNGPDLANGNYRDMFDSWIAYRNRMCTLTLFAYKKGWGANKTTKSKCMQLYNMEKLETLSNLYVNSLSVLDPEEFDGSNEDGGEAIGKKITPLQKKPQNDEVLVKDNTKSSSPETDSATKNAEAAPQNNKVLPSWAKK